MHHLDYLFITHCLAQLTAHLFDLLEVNQTRNIVVVQIEDLKQPLFASSISQFIIDHLEKLIETNVLSFSLQVDDHLEDGLVTFIES